LPLSRSRQPESPPCGRPPQSRFRQPFPPEPFLRKAVCTDPSRNVRRSLSSPDAPGSFEDPLSVPLLTPPPVSTGRKERLLSRIRSNRCILFPRSAGSRILLPARHGFLFFLPAEGTHPRFLFSASRRIFPDFFPHHKGIPQKKFF